MDLKISIQIICLSCKERFLNENIELSLLLRAGYRIAHTWRVTDVPG